MSVIPLVMRAFSLAAVVAMVLAHVRRLRRTRTRLMGCDSVERRLIVQSWWLRESIAGLVTIPVAVFLGLGAAVVQGPVAISPAGLLVTWVLASLGSTMCWSLLQWLNARYVYGLVGDRTDRR